MAAAKALAKAEADLAVITKAEAVAAKVGGLSGADTNVAVHAVFVAVPKQTCTRSSLVGKAQGPASLFDGGTRPGAPRPVTSVAWALPLGPAYSLLATRAPAGGSTPGGTQ